MASKKHLDLGSIYTRIGVIHRFLRNEETVETLFFGKLDETGRFSIDWPELLFFKSNLNRLGFFLFSCPLLLRRIIIMLNEVLGISKREFVRRAEITTDKITKFSGSENLKGFGQLTLYKLKEILEGALLNIEVPNRAYALASLFSRIPCKWLMHEEIELAWDNLQFDLLSPPVYSSGNFMKLLNSLDVSLHEVIAVRVRVDSGSHNLNLRIANVFGTVIIEVYNVESSAEDVYFMEKLLGRQCIISGFMKTVVPGKVNPAFVWKHQSAVKPSCLPIEFTNRVIKKRTERPISFKRKTSLP